MFINATDIIYMVRSMKREKSCIVFVLLTTLGFLILTSSFLSAQVTIPREDTVYVIGVQWGPPTTWNLFSPSLAYGGDEVLYIPLFMYSWMKDAWLPLIGEKFEWVSPDVMRIYIRPEAKWSDGEPITAYDVEYTFKITVEVGYGPGIGCQDYVEYIKAIDDKTLEAKIKDPPRNYFSFIGCVLGYRPMPKHVVEPLYEELGVKIKEWGNDNPEKQVVSGPYKLFYSAEDRIILERLDDWWGKDVFGLPAPKYLAHIIYKDNPSANLAFEKGEADYAGTFIPEVWKLFDKNIGTWYKDKPYYVGEGNIFLYLNHLKPMFKNVAVRKAIAYAIPYTEMIEKAYFGYSIQASLSMVNDLSPAYREWINRDLCVKYWGNPECRLPTDLERAKEILDNAGIIDRDGDGIRELPDGTKLSDITISVPYGWTDWMMMCEMIAENLRKIGIEVRTEFPDFSVWWNRIVEGTFDMIIGWDGGPGFDHPWNSYRWVLDPRIVAPAGNWERYNNTDIIPLIDEAASTTDPAKRKELYSEIQEMVYKEVPSVALFYGAHWYAYNTKYWVGWPTEDNPWWFPVAPWSIDSLPLLFGIAKAGETPKPPEWLKPMEEGGLLIPTSYIWEGLAKATSS